MGRTTRHHDEKSQIKKSIGGEETKQTDTQKLDA
jgi:hypothetical protein